MQLWLRMCSLMQSHNGLPEASGSSNLCLFRSSISAFLCEINTTNEVPTDIKNKNNISKNQGVTMYTYVISPDLFDRVIQGIKDL